MEKISEEYIRGLTEGEGSFTFYTTPKFISDGKATIKLKRPAFAIKMHERDAYLLNLVADRLNLKGNVYHNGPYRYDRYGSRNSASQVTLIVRDVLELKNIIIPLFYKKLHGNKGKQFMIWLEKMGEEEMTTESHYLYNLYKKRFFDK
jgi:hypothetical protein